MSIPQTRVRTERTDATNMAICDNSLALLLLLHTITATVPGAGLKTEGGVVQQKHRSTWYG